jgi:hypothetical protein
VLPDVVKVKALSPLRQADNMSMASVSTLQNYIISAWRQKLSQWHFGRKVFEILPDALKPTFFFEESIEHFEEFFDIPQVVVIMG